MHAACSGPTRYYFYYGGVRHYYGTRTWGSCNGHCNQDVYIDEAQFHITYEAGTDTSFIAAAAKSALQQVWPSLDSRMVSTNVLFGNPPRVSFNALLPDGTSPLAFSNAVKSCLDRACGTVPGSCPLAQAPATDSLMVTTGRASCPQSVSVSMRQISTQAESGGAALTLPSMVCLVLAAVAALLR